MPYGFAKANSYWNKIAAWEDWCEVAKIANDAGLCDLVAKHQPPDDAGWRKIDKARRALTRDIAQREIQ